MVEAVRVGTIFAHDNKQYGRWAQSRRPQRPPLDDAGLEAAVMGIARMYPGNVTRGTV